MEDTRLESLTKALKKLIQRAEKNRDNNQVTQGDRWYFVGQIDAYHHVLALLASTSIN